MFLGIYRFEGDSSQLRRSYDNMLESIPTSNLHLHTCVVDDGGLTIFDSCPSKEIFSAFVASPEFNAAIHSAGLPAPTITPLGEVHAAFVSGERVL